MVLGFITNFLIEPIVLETEVQQKCKEFWTDLWCNFYSCLTDTETKGN